ncbi:MAG: sialate O-acetylesterase [Planctomycetota bacterium]|nr:sialate O-acetylesterase [Planctomycetota bacterium]
MKHFPGMSFLFLLLLLATTSVSNDTPAARHTQSTPEKTLRVFIVAGQSNMVGSDSKVQDIKNFPPFIGLEKPQKNVRFLYCLGRENKTRSKGWVDLQPVNNTVGPELSFARKLSNSIDDPIAIIKCAAGGTHLGGDWNPDQPTGFKMYPLTNQVIQTALQELEDQGLKYKIEAVMWHQGENDMFNEDYLKNYGKNLENFLAKWRRDLNAPRLKFFIGELCTKTIWGMDLRPRMYAISLGQKQVTGKDSNATYVPTAQIGVEIGGGVGLHYHYGTLGQLQHGVNYADAYLQSIDKRSKPIRPLKKWPYPRQSPIDLYILAGHRNMEGERAFVQFLEQMPSEQMLLQDQPKVAFKYTLGGGYLVSQGWEPMGLTGYYDTFGPELSFSRQLLQSGQTHFAVAKFTHSGSQIIDWTPAGSVAKSRMLYQDFIAFIKQSVKELQAKGNPVNLAGVIYHAGENDMSFYPYRKEAPQRIAAIIAQSRKDLNLPNLKWFVSQQPPTDDQSVNKIDVVTNLSEILATDPLAFHLQYPNLPKQEKKLVINTAGIIHLGKAMAEAVLQ